MDDYTNCPMCGRSVPIEINDEPVIYCPYCGTNMLDENGAEYPEEM